MPRIQVLSEGLANRIAAGEVVERPASVVKELVENAIDAGARRIEVELVQGGRELIRVRDDGSGMSPHDAGLAVQRFATSKIRQAEDLDAILTMGFRGEALPSIAAVSHFRLQTREPDSEEGCEVCIHGGGPAQVRAVGCPAGTTVEVKNIFFNTPARLKFLATTGRERGHCADWVSRLALSRPDISFKLTHDGQVVFSVPGTGDLRSVLAAMYGSAAARDFLPCEAEGDGIRVEGLISGPKLLRATREHQMFFVNRRFVRSRQIGHALNEAYGLLLPAGRNPLCALHLTVEPERVDPNVHPTKIEVRFRHSGAVHGLVQRAAEETLSAAGYRSLTQSRRHVDRPEEGSSHRSDAPLPAGRFEGSSVDEIQRARRLRVNPFEDRVDERDEGLDVFAEPVVQLPQPEPAEGTLPVELPPAAPEVLGQIGRRYIVARVEDALLLIDQHRAAERVLLERLSARQVARQLLVLPETLQLTAGEAAACVEHAETLNTLGYETEAFGGNSVLVRSVPVATANFSPVEVLRDVISDLATWNRPDTAERIREKTRATIACHAATKAGARLRPDEMRRLVADLMQSDSPGVCPHGDPIIVSFSLDRLDREFRR